jgi:hypothetical protein
MAVRLHGEGYAGGSALTRVGMVVLIRASFAIGNRIFVWGSHGCAPRHKHRVCALIAHVTDDGEAATVGLERQKYRQLQAVRRVEWARSGATGNPAVRA